MMILSNENQLEDHQKKTNLQAHFRVDILFKHSKRNNGQWSETNIEEEHVPVVIYRLSRKTSKRLKIKDCEAKCNVLVEEITNLRQRVLQFGLELIKDSNSMKVIMFASSMTKSPYRIYWLQLIRIYYHLSYSFITPVSMYNQKPLQELKLSNSKVASHHSLQATDNKSSLF